jgi:hypothetical protein
MAPGVADTIVSDDGWTKSYRRKWRHPVFRNFRDAAVWAYLTDNAAWADNTDTRFDGDRIMLMAGEIAVSERFLAEGFACDRQVIRRIFDALEKDRMITRRKTHRATIITICNYKTYQSPSEMEEPAEPEKKTQPEPSANPNIEEPKNTIVVVPRALIIEVGNKVLSLVGADKDPNCRINASLVEVWLKREFDAEFDIYPTIRRMMAQGPPNIRSLKFFDDAIAQAYADRNRSIREPNYANRPRQAKPTAEQRLTDQLRELDILRTDQAGPLESFGDAAGGPIIDQPANCH